MNNLLAMARLLVWFPWCKQNPPFESIRRFRHHGDKRTELRAELQFMSCKYFTVKKSKTALLFFGVSYFFKRLELEISIQNGKPLPCLLS